MNIIDRGKWMKNEINVHIVLLNYNGYEDTIECIKSLCEINYNNFNIVVVDNNSTDKSEEKIKAAIKGKNKIHFIQTGENLGFSGGNNVGIKWSLVKNADYICLLNNDTVVEKDFLIKLINEMEHDNRIGISAGKIMYFNDKNTIWSAGGFINEIKSLGKHYGINELEKKCKYEEKKQVTFLTGCLQLIRREVFENIGLYDNEYFLYMEDVDFCKRATNAGYKLMYIPDSKIYHKVSSSTGGDESPLQLYYIIRNRILYNKKNGDNILNSIMFYIFIVIKMTIELFRKGKNYKYMVVGVKDALQGKYGPRDIKSI